MTYYKIFSFRNGDAVKGYLSLQACATEMGVTALEMHDIIKKKKNFKGLTFRCADEISDFYLDKIYGQLPQEHQR
ncbi:MAG: hypothetical protein Q4F69_11175 [Bacteroidia bacterium]|nr:hypothetical protein [Bacteroidia bacterium]